MTGQQIVAGLIFLITFAIILSEKIHRTIIAMAGAVIMVMAGLIMGFYSHHRAIEALDFETLGLLMGMMILVALLKDTGFFEYVAILIAKRSKGNAWILLVFLGTATTCLSMFLDNVTTVVLIAPVTLLIAEILGINPIPILLGEGILANIGGVATLVGDPPNIIIGSATGFTFNDFLTHLAPIVIIAWIATLFSLKFMFKKELSTKPRNIKGLQSLDEKKSSQRRGQCEKNLCRPGPCNTFLFFPGKTGSHPRLYRPCRSFSCTSPGPSRYGEGNTLCRVECSSFLCFSFYSCRRP